MAGAMERAAALGAGKQRVEAQATAPKPSGFYPQQGQQAPQQEQPPATEPEQIQRVDTVAGVAANARQMARRLPGPITQEQPASAEEQAEYERATDALSRVLYEDDKTSAAVLSALQPEDKIGSVAQTAMLLVQQLDDKIDLDESVIPQLTMDIVDRLMDLGEQGKAMTFSDEEAQGALGAAWEGVLNMYGMGGPEDFAEVTQGMSDEDLSGQVQTYKGFLGGDFNG